MPWLLMVLLPGIVILLMDTKPLTIGYLIAWCLILIALFVVPAYFPWTYDGLTSAVAAVDHWGYKHTKPAGNTKQEMAKSDQCRALNNQIDADFNAKKDKIQDMTISAPAQAIELAKAEREANDERQKIYSSYCSQPVPDPETPRPAT